jgi:hypothetical protein
MGVFLFILISFLYLLLIKPTCRISKMPKLISCLFILLSVVNAREIRVIEVVDANLFRTSDSTLISMVNLEVPSLNDPDSNRIEIAKNAVKIAKLNLLKQKLRFEETYKNKCAEESVKKGHLFRVYPFSDKSINELFLEKGYAIYVPCDTLYMDIYRIAATKSMNNRNGLWKPYKEKKKSDLYNRFRVSALIIDEYFNKDRDFLPPLFGFNYRWSDLIGIVQDSSFNINLSAETGTLLYFFLPYVNIGSEVRYRYFYGRIHYDALLPLFFFLDNNKLESISYWGFDLGFIIPVNEKGIEVEFNSKRREGLNFNYISISFAVY